MASGLPSEFFKFHKQAKQLKHILSDTKRCFQDINAAGKFETGPPITAELSDEEEEEIFSVIVHPPCLVIFGQTLYAKAFVVNELFNKTLLPQMESSDATRWRMVRFTYGDHAAISLSLPGSFELVDNLTAYSRPWQTVPPEDLQLPAARQAGAAGPNGAAAGEEEEEEEEEELADGIAWLEVRQPHPLLKENAQVVVAPWNTETVEKVYKQSTDGVTPILIYAISKDALSDKDLDNLRELKQIARGQPVLFIKVPSPVQFELKQTLINNTQVAPMRTIQNAIERHSLGDKLTPAADPDVTCSALTVIQQLLDVGYLNLLPAPKDTVDANEYRVDSDLIDKFANFPNIVLFVRKVLRSYLVRTTNLLNVVHARCLRNFIDTAFDMQRDMMITPRRLEFARQKETELYAMLMEMALKKQDEIKQIISETIADMRIDLLQNAADFQFQGVRMSDPQEGEILSPRDLKSCTAQIQNLVLSTLNAAVAGKLLGSVNVLKDSYTGVLARCLESLEQSDRENSDSVRTTMALREILNSAYHVEITARAGSSIIKLLLEKMKQLMAAVLWTPPPRVNKEWKRKVADDMLNSLSESRLSKSICSQIKDRLKNSHDHFSTALRQLEARHSGRLERTEEQRLTVRKVQAPKVARLALESISLRDYVLYGMPHLGREMGRGQYGVVYSCESWGGYSPCATKSVVPPDDKHWNDLALEFFYTKNLPEHDRVVVLRGSVIDYSYGGGCSPAVLLMMDRLQRDLYTAIKFNLDWLSRLQVAIDVVEGIRFLHSQGLVHRDIKLKNVLLDRRNRGKITDLGFCKPEAMMSGSIVGTPIHMAPELFSGRYDNSVDVYAFGILFWYVCAGHVKLPYNFELCTSKDMLWTSVKRGARPERLPQFNTDCWEMMTACWHSKPEKRPLLGVVEPRLRNIHERHRGQASRDGMPGTKRTRHRDKAAQLTETDTRQATTTTEAERAL